MLTSSTHLQNRSFTVVERTRTYSNYQKMKNARAKRAKILFFIVKYANLWGFCCRRRRGCLSTLLRTGVPLTLNIYLAGTNVSWNVNLNAAPWSHLLNELEIWLAKSKTFATVCWKPKIDHSAKFQFDPECSHVCYMSLWLERLSNHSSRCWA